jgi:hypothetical protein
MIYALLQHLCRPLSSSTLINDLRAIQKRECRGKGRRPSTIRQEQSSFSWHSHKMQRLLLLTAICIVLLSSCSLGISQEVKPPAPAAVTTGPVSQPSETPLATVMASNQTTAVASPTLSPTYTATPETVAQFHNLRFAGSGYGLPQARFATGTEEIFAIWEYVGLSGEDRMERVWTRNGAEWLVREEVWDVTNYGSAGTIRDVSVYDFEGGGLEPGSYQLTLYLNGVYQAQAAFQIQDELNLASSTETQRAWVQDGNILMLDAWDGSQRELVRANEIVELLWLPDAQHLLYVDQRAQPDPSGPPWPQHALWLLDTETADQHQLGTFDENLHRIGLLPGSRYIRTLPGSDFGDACFIDRRLVFVELDENYQRVALHDLHEFESELTGKPYWFFPEDEGKGISDHEYEVSLTAFCLTADMGASSEDLALIGRYRLDLELGTAVKISFP